MKRIRMYIGFGMFIFSVCCVTGCGEQRKESGAEVTVADGLELAVLEDTLTADGTFTCR